MPRELLPHFSPRSSDTGPNLGYRCDPLLKEKVIIFHFFSNLTSPWSNFPKHQNYSYKKPDERLIKMYDTSPVCVHGAVPGVGFMLINALLSLHYQFEECTFCITTFSKIAIVCLCHLTKNQQALQIIGKSRAFHGLLQFIQFRDMNSFC